MEEMASRQNSIGSGHHRENDGVPDLSSLNLGNGAGTNGHRGSFSDLPPPPPPKQAGAPTQVTADQLAYGKEDSGGFGFKGKKKSSKQRFAERQVGVRTLSVEGPKLNIGFFGSIRRGDKKHFCTRHRLMTPRGMPSWRKNDKRRSK